MCHHPTHFQTLTAGCLGYSGPLILMVCHQRPLRMPILASCGGLCLKSQLLGRPRQKDHRFEVSIANFTRPYFKIKNEKGWRCSSVPLQHLPSMYEVQFPVQPKTTTTKKYRSERSNHHGDPPWLPLGPQRSRPQSPPAGIPRALGLGVVCKVPKNESQLSLSFFFLQYRGLQGGLEL